MNLSTQITEILENAVQEHVFPGAVFGYLKDGEEHIHSVGHFTYEPSSPVVTPDTAYDVASVTKSIPTSCLVMYLIDQGVLTLDSKVIEYIPELDNQYREDITVKHLLTYTVVFEMGERGLASFAEEGRDAIEATIFKLPLKTSPGEQYIYGNTIGILLGLVAERAGKKPLNELAQDIFFTPLEMKNTSFLPVDISLIPPTSSDDWRGEVQGLPHDEASWVLRQTGTVTGNAGLFSTAADLLTFLKMIINDGQYAGHRYFSTEAVQMMYTNQISQLGKSAGLGWELNEPRFMGSHSGPHTFGKTGYTGCLVLADPLKKRALTLISNRTHPTRPKTAEQIHSVRCHLADLILTA